MDFSFDFRKFIPTKKLSKKNLKMSRINIDQVSPEANEPMLALEKYIAKSGLEKKLYHLIKTRASQINGCHYCINMHTRDALKEGETAQRLFLLDAWRECGDLYTEKEKAVLALTESMTLISTHRVSDEVYNAAAAVLTEKELAAVIMAIVAINGWNRIAVATHLPLD